MKFKFENHLAFTENRSRFKETTSTHRGFQGFIFSLLRSLSFSLMFSILFPAVLYRSVELSRHSYQSSLAFRFLLSKLFNNCLLGDLSFQRLFLLSPASRSLSIRSVVPSRRRYDSYFSFWCLRSRQIFHSTPKVQSHHYKNHVPPADFISLLCAYSPSDRITRQW